MDGAGYFRLESSAKAPPPDAWITFVVPVYNGVADLVRGITSLQEQTDERWRAIIIDDGSTDDSFALARHFAEHDTRISAISLEHGGIATARNAGVARTWTRWIAPIDHDDRLLPHALERMGRLIERFPGSRAFAWGEAVEARGGVRVTLAPLQIDEPRRVTFTETLQGYGLRPVIRRDLFGELGGYSTCGMDDLDLAIRAAQYGEPYIMDDQPSYVWRPSPRSVSADAGYMSSRILTTLRLARERETDPQSPRSAELEARIAEVEAMAWSNRAREDFLQRTDLTRAELIGTYHEAIRGRSPLRDSWCWLYPLVHVSPSAARTVLGAVRRP